MNRIRFKLFLAILVLTSLSVQAAQVDDIRIVIDVSGSMVKTDPHNLRVPALRLMTGLIPSGSKAGVWTFGRYVNMEVKWGKVDERWRKLAQAGASKIHSRGQFTNIEGAIKRATSSWKKPDPNTNRSLILLTDGKVDISKNKDKNMASRRRVLDKSIPLLVKRGIKVYTIALSDRTDEALLKRLALKTSGSFEIAQNAKDLQRIFLRMFERAAKPDTVPLKGNKFIIDKSIKEMTLLVFKKSTQQTSLIEPGGTRQRQNKHGAKVSWRSEQGYDLITVKKPRAGEWILDADIDPDNRVMIVTDLKLQVDNIPAYVTPDQSINIKLELHNKNTRISKKSFLKFVDFTLTHKVGEQTETFPMKLKKSREIKDKGIYLQKIKAPLQEGTHEILLQADARTFKRSKRFSVEVQWPVSVEISKTRQPGIYQLKIEPRAEYIKPDSLRLAVKLQNPTGESAKIKMQRQGQAWAGEVKADAADGLHQLLISMQAQNVEGETVQHDLQPYSILGIKKQLEPPAQPDPVAEQAAPVQTEQDKVEAAAEIIEETPEPESADWVMTLIILGVSNLVLILIGVGIWVFMRKRRFITDVEALYEEDGDAADDSSEAKS
jgi:uncharacterized protein (TIGR03503 family)